MHKTSSNFKSDRSALLESNRNEAHNIVQLAKMPVATAEQLSIAKILARSEDDGELRKKIQQIQEYTECTMEAAVCAWHDCDYDLQKAIEYLLDGEKSGEDTEWQTIVTKRSKTKKIEKSIPVKAKPIRSNGADGNGEFPVSRDSPKMDSFDKRETSDPKQKNEIVRNDNVPRRTTKTSLAPSTASVNKKRNANRENTQRQKEKSLVNTEVLKKVTVDPQTGWDSSLECGEWTGEAIEIVNSNSVFDFKNMTECDLIDIVSKDATDEFVEEVTPVSPAVSCTSKSESENVVQAARASVFAVYASTTTPTPSIIPSMPVFFAPNSGGGFNHGNIYRFGDTVLQSTLNLPIVHKTNTAKEGHPKLEPSNQYPTAIVRLDSHVTCESDQDMTKQKLQESSRGRSVVPLHENATNSIDNLADTYAKLQREVEARSRAVEPASNFSGQQQFKNYTFEEISQQLSKIVISGSKNDNFSTTSTGVATQKGVLSAPYQNISVKPATIPHQANKALAANVQHPPVTVPQLVMSNAQAHAPIQPPLQPGMPQILGQFPPASFQMYSYGNSTNNPTIYELEQMATQRLLYDIHQHQQQQQHTPSEAALVCTSGDALSTNKPTSAAPPTSHSSSALGHQMMPGVSPYLSSYPGYIVMNGFPGAYPNAYINQQQASQSGNAQNQVPPHSATPLTQQQNTQAQYMKAMSANANSYPNFPGMHSSGYDGIAEMKYPGLTKQVGYKPSQPSVYGSQSIQQGNADLTLSAKLQQAPGTTSTLNTQHSMQQAQPSVGNQYLPGAHPGSFTTPYMNQFVTANVAAAVQASRCRVTNDE